VERDTRPTALVDLTRPAYKLGMMEIKVGRREYALNVKVAPERDTFRVREHGARLHRGHGERWEAGRERRDRARRVDEGLLELQDNASWNILDAIAGRAAGRGVPPPRARGR
jgi:hypothetical protein